MVGRCITAPQMGRSVALLLTQAWATVAIRLRLGLLDTKRIVNPWVTRRVALGRWVKLFRIPWTLLTEGSLSLHSRSSIALVFGLVVPVWKLSAFRVVTTLANKRVNRCILLREQSSRMFSARNLTILCVRPLPMFMFCPPFVWEAGFADRSRLRQISTTGRRTVVLSRLQNWLSTCG